MRYKLNYSSCFILLYHRARNDSSNGMEHMVYTGKVSVSISYIYEAGRTTMTTLTGVDETIVMHQRYYPLLMQWLRME